MLGHREAIRRPAYVPVFAELQWITLVSPGIGKGVRFLHGNGDFPDVLPNVCSGVGVIEGVIQVETYRTSIISQR